MRAFTVIVDFKEHAAAQEGIPAQMFHHTHVFKNVWAEDGNSAMLCIQEHFDKTRPYTAITKMATSTRAELIQVIDFDAIR